MTASELLDYLGELGVRASAAGDHLRLEAPRGTVTEQLARELRSRKTELLDLLRARERHEMPLVRRSREAASTQFPLSFAQHGFFLLDQMDPGNSAYNIFSLRRIRRPLDAAMLGRALARVVSRNEILRTTFHRDANAVVQRVCDAAQVPVREIDLTHVPQELRDAALERLLSRDRAPRFRLDEGPLLSVELVRIGQNDSVLRLAMHHIIGDAVTLDLLWQQLAQAYSSVSAGVREAAPPSFQYGDYSSWQQERLARGEYDSVLDYWRGALAGCVPLLPRMGAGTPSSRSTVSHQRLAAEQRARLSSFAQRHEISPFGVLLAAFKLLLSRYARVTDVTVLVPISKRDRSELRAVMGPFLSVVALRTSFAHETVGGLLKRTRTAAAEALENSDIPVEVVEGLLRRRRTAIPSLNGLSRVAFNYLERTDGSGGQPDIEVIESDRQEALFELMLVAVDSPTGLSLRLELKDGLFPKDFGTIFMRHYRALLETMVRQGAGAWLEELDFATPQELASELKLHEAAAPAIARADSRQLMLIGSSPHPERRMPVVRSECVLARSVSRERIERVLTRLIESAACLRSRAVVSVATYLDPIYLAPTAGAQTLVTCDEPQLPRVEASVIARIASMTASQAWQAVLVERPDLDHRLVLLFNELHVDRATAGELTSVLRGLLSEGSDGTVSLSAFEDISGKNSSRIELPPDLEAIALPVPTAEASGAEGISEAVSRTLAAEDVRLLRSFCDQASIDVADALRFAVSATLGVHLHLRAPFYIQTTERRVRCGQTRAGICVLPGARTLAPLGIAEAVGQLRHLGAKQAAWSARTGDLEANALEVHVSVTEHEAGENQAALVHPDDRHQLRVDIDLTEDGARFSVCGANRLLRGTEFPDRLSHVIRQLPRVARYADLDLLLPGEADRYTSLNLQRHGPFALRCAHELVLEQAARTPDRTAVAFNDTVMTYAQLAGTVRRLARWLRARYPEGQVAIGLAAFRSADLPASILGILASGCSYVPLDPRGPEARVRQSVAEAGVRLILTDEMNRQRWPEVDVPRVTVGHATAGSDEETPLPHVDADATAYLMFTSGSSGRPKGVPIHHAALTNFLHSMAIEPGVADADVVMATTTVIFDISLLELLLPLIAGASIVVAADAEICDGAKLIQAMRRHRVTLMQATPSLWQLVLAAGWPEGNAVRALCGGELMPETLRRSLNQRAAELWNMYGPTETTIWSACMRMAPEVTGRVIGRPIADTQLFIVDACGRRVPPGLPGEICIAGAGLSRGYLAQPELTTARFVQLGGAGLGCRVYRTGDLGLLDAHGRLNFLGRIDRQLKVRGHLVEPAEIEHALSGVANVTRVLVCTREAAEGEVALVAYVECADAQVTEQTLRDRMRECLPAALIPQHIVILNVFPVLPNGKIDVTKLAGESGRAPSGAAAAPGTDLERELFAIWAELLGRHDFGVADNFFEIGGHSILLVRSHAMIVERLEAAVEVVDLFNHPTIEALAALVESRRVDREPQPPAAPRRIEIAAAPGEAAHEIAVIGMAGRFPGAETVQVFWRNLMDGVESVTRFSAEELIADGADPALVRRSDYVPAAAMLRDAEGFDAEFFRFGAREAELTDPQHRLLLECAHAALEDAGYDPGAIEAPVGLFAGVGFSSYLISNLLRNPALLASSSPFELLYANDKDYAVTQIAYRLNLRGPCISLGTACSTGLVAVHEACRSLRDRECDVALAGAAKVLTPQRRGYVSLPGGITAPDGRCRPFDQDGTGTIFGSGGGIVVLKRLGDAVRDRDSIYAVIKGSAVNNDGASKVGFTAPSRSGQAQVIRAALAAARVAPESIGLIEAHGTATSLGDLIEFRALCDVFGSRGATPNACALGSVKANIGHLDPAAGIAGFIKAVLAVHHASIPPAVNFSRPNGRLGLSESPFFVNTRAQPWKAAEPRRAGVSAFGIGGTNAHAVIEQAPEPAARESANDATELLVLSAATSEALDRYRSRLSQAIAESTGTLGDIAFTLQQGRAPLRYRWAGAAATRDAAVHGLSLAQAHRFAAVANRHLVFMLPDEGTQHPGMARGLYDRAPTFRRELDQCLRVVQRICGVDLLPWMLGEASPSITPAPSQSALAQPVVFAFSYALARQLIDWGLRPQGMIGVGVGECVAACLAGVFPAESGMELVTERARLLQSADPSPARFEAVVAGISRQPPTVPFISGLSGTWITALESVSPAYWVRQMKGRIRFEEGLQHLQRDGAPTTLLEVGPDDALTDLAEPNRREGNLVLACLPGSHSPVPRETLFLDSVGRLWCAGHDIDWAAFGAGKASRRVHLPTYPFARKRHWIDATAAPREALVSAAAPARTDIRDWLYEPSWKRRMLPERPGDASAGRTAWLVFASEDPVANALLESLREAGHSPLLVSRGTRFSRANDGFEIDPTDEASWTRLARELPEADRLNVAWFWSVCAPSVAEADVLVYPVMLARALKGLGRERVHLAFFTAGLHAVHGGEGGDALAALCLGPARTLPREWADCRCVAIDLPEDRSRATQLARLAYAEFMHDLQDEVVAYRRDARWVECFERRPESAASSYLKKSATYLLTGGLGGIGFELARHLVSHWDSRLIIVGRSPASAVRVQNCLAELAAQGGRVGYITADVADERQLRAAVEDAEQRLGRIGGAFHLAGVADGKLIEFRRAEEMCAIVAGKVRGALGLSRLLSERDAAFLVLFSSVSAFLGDVGQVAYTAANAFLSIFAARSPVPTVAIAWDTWREAGMAVSTEVPQALRALRDRALANAISPPEGLRVLERILTDRAPSLVVSTMDLEQRILRRRTRAVERLQEAGTSLGLHARPVLSTEFVAPDSETERAIADLWSDSLRIAPVGATDDFFSLGGTSLHAVQLASRLQSRLGRPVLPEALLQHGTVRALAAFLDEQAEASERPQCLVELKRGHPGQMPLFLVHPVGGQVMVYRELVQALADEHPVFGIKADASRDSAATVEEIATDYVAAVLAVHPSGPFLLGGSSFGGMVAFEMAQQLTRAGHDVALLVLIDTPAAEQIMAPLKSEAELVEYLRPQFPSLEQGSALQELVATFRTNDSAMRRYRADPYAGRVIYLKARVRREEDPPEPDAPWRNLCAQFELLEVPGDHLTMHVSPNVEFLAAGLSAGLGVRRVPT